VHGSQLQSSWSPRTLYELCYACGYVHIRPLFSSYNWGPIGLDFTFSSSTFKSQLHASDVPSVSATPHKPQAFGYQKHPIMPGGRLDSGPGQRCIRLSSHVLVVVFCGLDWGTRRLFPRGI